MVNTGSQHISVLVVKRNAESPVVLKIALVITFFSGAIVCAMCDCAIVDGAIVCVNGWCIVMFKGYRGAGSWVVEGGSRGAGRCSGALVNELAIDNSFVPCRCGQSLALNVKRHPDFK